MGRAWEGWALAWAAKEQPRVGSVGLRHVAMGLDLDWQLFGYARCWCGSLGIRSASHGRSGLACTTTHFTSANDGVGVLQAARGKRCDCLVTGKQWDL